MKCRKVYLMYKELIHTPEGVRDIYGTEYAEKLAILRKIQDTVYLNGYESIQTPTFEYFDVFSKEIGTTQSRDLYKFFDRTGDTLVLRPDFTPGVARCVAKYFDDADKPVKLTYSGNVFVNNSSYQGKLKETTHTGVELMNDLSVEADAEVINLAIECLKSTGLSDFQVAIGHMEYFKGLCAASGITEADELKLREYISGKNNVPALELLDSLNCDEKTRELLLLAGDSIGDISVIEGLKSKVTNERALCALERLIKIHEIIKLMGNERYISFDLGLLSKYNYYTGVIFKAYTFGVGDAVIKGGRYDNLISSFGNPKPATGFVILIDDLLMALKRQDIEIKVKDKPIVLEYTEADYEDKLMFAARLRHSGKAVSLIPKS